MIISNFEIIISKEQIEKFQKIFKGYYGKEISTERALEQGEQLVRLLKLVYKPMTENEFKRLQEYDKKNQKIII